MNVSVETFNDLVEHVLDYIGGTVTDEMNLRYARRAVIRAYDAVSSLRKWNYYYQRGRLVTVAHQTEGTIAYTQSTRAVTLTDSTWPTWAASGQIQIDNITYDVDGRDSSTQLTLSATYNPGANIASGTTYVLYQDTFTLPDDFKATDQMMILNNSGIIFNQHPAQWLAEQQIIRGPATPSAFTITKDPDNFGVMAARLYPAPDNVYQLDFIYQRQPRPLKIENYATGTVACTSSSATLTGTSTVWTSAMVGSVIRLSGSSSAAPTSFAGENPTVMERQIKTYSSATSITVDEVADRTLSGVKYIISDPVDIEAGAMATFLYRECERQMRIIKQMKGTEDAERQHQEAMYQAFDNDSRSSEPRAAGQTRYYRPSVKDMPLGPEDVS